MGVEKSFWAGLLVEIIHGMSPSCRDICSWQATDLADLLAILTLVVLLLAVHPAGPVMHPTIRVGALPFGLKQNCIIIDTMRTIIFGRHALCVTWLLVP